MWSKVRAALAGPAVHTVWHPHSLGYPRASSTVLGCTVQPQETGLKIQSMAPFKGSAGNSWNQTVEGKRCVFERWPILEATHSSLMNRQVGGGAEKSRICTSRRQRRGWIVVCLRMSTTETHTKCLSVGSESRPPSCPCPCRTIYSWML